MKKAIANKIFALAPLCDFNTGIPHKDFDHPLVQDYYYGTTKIEAEKRIREMLKTIDKRDGIKITPGQWWKFWR